MEKELLDLRAQVSQQEQLLQSTAARLKKANQRKKSMEQFIVSHRRCPWRTRRGGLFLTHPVLQQMNYDQRDSELLREERLGSNGGDRGGVASNRPHPVAEKVL